MTQREPELAGQTVVVIGGSAGIGLETARRARAEGADVVLAARNPERLRSAADEVGAVSSAAFDATDPAALEGFFADLPTPIDHVHGHGRPPVLRAARRHRRRASRADRSTSTSGSPSGSPGSPSGRCDPAAAWCSWAAPAAADPAPVVR